MFPESEDVSKVSKMQKIFAKRSIKREKRKEKEHKKKVEKSKLPFLKFSKLNLQCTCTFMIFM